MRRVVVTGVGNGHATGLRGRGVLATFVGGARPVPGPITRFDASRLATTYACEVPRGDGSDGNNSTPMTGWTRKKPRKVDEFILYGVAAAEQAIHDSGWMPQDEESRCRTGVMIGSGIGGLQSIADTSILLRDRGPRRVSPFFIPSALINLVSGQVSIRHGFKRAEPCGCDSLFHRRACHWRCGAANPVGRCRCDDRGWCGKPRFVKSVLPGSTLARRCPPSVPMTRKRPRAPMTWTATVS